MEEDPHKKKERLSGLMPVICGNEEEYWKLMDGVATHRWIDLLQGTFNEAH